MHQADPHRRFGRKALTRQQIPAQAARLHRTQKERDQRPRRKAEPHLRQRKKCTPRGNDNVAAGHERDAAADAGAVDERNGRFRQAVERKAEARNGGARRILRPRLLVPDLRPDTEVLAARPQHNRANRRIPPRRAVSASSAPSIA